MHVADERARTRTRATNLAATIGLGKIAGTGFVQRMFWGLRAASAIVLEIWHSDETGKWFALEGFELGAG